MHDASASLPGPAAEALRAEEAARASGFGRVVAMLAGIGLIMVPWLGGPRWLQALMIAATGALAATSVWMWREAATGRYSRRTFRVFGIVGISSVAVVQAYFGIFSPAPLVVTLGISFVGPGHDEKLVNYLFIIAPATYILLAVPILTGLVADPGLVTAADTPLVVRVFLASIVPIIYAAAFWQARKGREAMVEAVEGLHRAIGLAEQRGAQLVEAHQNLDMALQAGGQGGRFSGTTIESWQLAEVLGRGAMGEVYAATNLDTGDLAAVKVLQAGSADEPEHLRRFEREIEISAQLRHPNLVTVFDAGTANGVGYIAMERLQGQDLGRILRRRGQLAPSEVAELLDQVAAGLGAAHDKGIVHRDIKPSNLFYAEATVSNRRWKILDFGVSTTRGSGGTLTQRAVIGTPGYMSPEQAQGRQADPRSDVFSLAAVAYRALTGRPPFSGEDLPQILFEIVFRHPARPGAVVPALGHDIDHVVALALAKRAEDRFATAVELAASFRAACGGDLAVPLRRRAMALQQASPWGDIQPTARDDRAPTQNWETLTVPTEFQRPSR